MAPQSQPASPPIERARRLACWRGPIEIEIVKGGITNANFRVSEGAERYFVRIGDDIPVHGVLRFNELAASRAAAECGLSPSIHHAEPGAIVFRYIDGHTLSAEDVRKPAMLARILDLVRRCHGEMKRHVRGPALIFWVFHVLRDYGHNLEDGRSRHREILPRLLGIAETLERALGPVEIVYAHNDLLPSNFIDDGRKLWLIDWDYAGFNSPLFDLANLCSNNEVPMAAERDLLAAYFGETPNATRWRSYQAMKCASLLRETLWSMISEVHSTLDFDYAAYTAENLARFERAYEDFQQIRR